MNQSTVSISDDEVKVTLGQPNRFNTSVGNGYEHDSKSINSTPSKISKFTYNGKERYNTRRLNKVLEISVKINNTIDRSSLLIDKIFFSS